MFCIKGVRTGAIFRVIFILTVALLITSCAGYVGRTDTPSFSDNGSGVLRVSMGLGGDVFRTNQRIRKLQRKNVLFVVDGDCFSSCTQILNHNYPHVCWTDRAAFHFHGSSSPSRGGETPVTAVVNLLMVMDLPSYVRDHLPPVTEWTPSTWFTIRAADLPEAGHCKNNERYLTIGRDDYGNWISSYEGPAWDDGRRDLRDVSDEQFLENVRRSLAEVPATREGFLETMMKLRPHLKEQLEALREAEA